MWYYIIMHDKYITIIDIFLIYYQSDVFTDLSSNKNVGYAFFNRMCAFSDKMFAFSLASLFEKVDRFL
jgi:hypothetical protein